VLRRESRKEKREVLLVVTFGFESSDASSIPGMGTRTFSGLALNKRSRRLYKGVMSHSLAENMDLVVIHDGTPVAKGGGLLRRETRKGTTHRYTFWS
jgi:hypothetical protein